MTSTDNSRIAVILFNLGGPDRLDAVEPFLFNLFRDPAILSIPNPFRWLLAKLISKRRAPLARDIYRQIGNRSPIVGETQAQAQALEVVLSDNGDFRCFTVMRYWNPFSSEVITDVMAYQPDKVVLLPLYPQFSDTTTASSVNDWKKTAAKAGLNAPHHTICCYPDAVGLITAHTDLLKDCLRETGNMEDAPRILFSAHGLPKKNVLAGDPYQGQVEQTVAAVIRQLEEDQTIRDFDPVICYQSRVGPLEWIGPSLEDEINRAGNDEKRVIVVPISFVSDHSETLVELDIKYHELAKKSGVKDYIRIPALKTNPQFITGLAELVKKSLSRPASSPHQLGRICPHVFSDPGSKNG